MPFGGAANTCGIIRGIARNAPAPAPYCKKRRLVILFIALILLISIPAHPLAKVRADDSFLASEGVILQKIDTNFVPWDDDPYLNVFCRIQMNGI
jgi:hypothetical protein